MTIFKYPSISIGINSIELIQNNRINRIQFIESMTQHCNWERGIPLEIVTSMSYFCLAEVVLNQLTFKILRKVLKANNFKNIYWEASLHTEKKRPHCQELGFQYNINLESKLRNLQIKIYFAMKFRA